MVLSESEIKRIKRLLIEVAEQLYASGINVLPVWSRGSKKMPAVRKGEQYIQWQQRRMTREEFESFTIARLEDMNEFRYALGIAIVNGIGGVATIDFDPAKTPDPLIQKRVNEAVDTFGSFVYMERRIGLSGKKYGFHAILRVPNARALNIKINSPYKSEFSVRTTGITVVAPSLRIEGKEVSMYVKQSFVDIPSTYYDKDLSVLTRIIEVLGGKIEKIVHGIPSEEGGSRRGEPAIGLKIGKEIREPRQALLFLLDVGSRLGCEGFVEVVRNLMEGRWIVEYRILRDVVDVRHYRSTWTIIENHIFRILAEVGVPRGVCEKIAEMIREAELKYIEENGVEDAAVLDHVNENLFNNLDQALSFKEHGHDPSGACVYKLLGLCSKPCTTTFLSKVFSNAPLLKTSVMKVIERVRSLG